MENREVAAAESLDPADSLAAPPDGALTRAAVSGGMWMILSTLSTKLLGGLKIIILARILSPGEFGLMGLALAIVVTLNVLSNPGVYTALIRKPQLDDDDLNAGWWIDVVRSTLLFLLVFLLAGRIALFFQEPALGPVLQAVSLTFLLQCLQSIGQLRLNRELDFRRLAWLQQVPNLAGFLAAVLLAWTLRNVWALVGAHLAQLIAYLLLSYILVPFRPRFRLDWERARPLLRFGAHLFVAMLFAMLVVRGNELVLGKLTGVTAYGYYALAASLVSTLSSPIEQLITVVAFPALARIQVERERLFSAVARVFRLTILLGTPVLLGMAVFSRDGIVLVLGERWEPMVVPLVFLCLYSWIDSLTLGMQTIHYAAGQAGIETRLRLFSFLFYAAGVIPMTHVFGVEGAACWLFITGVFTFVVHVAGTAPEFRPVFLRAVTLLAGSWPLYGIVLSFAAALYFLPLSRFVFVILGLLYAGTVAAFAWRREKDLLQTVLGTFRKRI